MSKINPLKGLSLLDIALLKENGLYDSIELQELIKRYGTLERTLSLHIRLLNEIPIMHKKIYSSIIKNDTPFKILIRKISEIENRIEKFISLMLETEVELPQSLNNYVRLDDLLEIVKKPETKPSKDTPNPLTDLEKENKTLNRELEARNKVIKKLKKRTKYKLGELKDSQIESIADETRKKNGTINYTKAGNRLGVSRDTVRREIEKRNLLYLKNSP